MSHFRKQVFITKKKSTNLVFCLSDCTCQQHHSTGKNIHIQDHASDMLTGCKHVWDPHLSCDVNQLQSYFFRWWVYLVKKTVIFFFEVSISLFNNTKSL